MPPRITDSQRKTVVEMLAQGFDRETVAARVGVTPGQVSAVAAHVKMGTYEKPRGPDTVLEFTPPEVSERVHELLEEIGAANRRPPPASSGNHILIGVDAEMDVEVFWNPDPSNGAANPHMLILGESGFGKTYAICGILTELAQQNIPSVVFDYGQGFAVESSPRQFVEHAKPIELRASREGIAINPLQLFPGDVYGPVNVAQRVADTFQRVYPQIGVQQHAILRQAVLDVMNDAGIIPESRMSWDHSPPPFASLQRKLQTYAENPSHPQRRIASSVASQQPEDFSSVAFANTAPKMVFQVGHDKSVVSRRLARKVVNSHSFAEITELITRLPRGWVYFISENVGRVVRIHSFEERMARWRQQSAL